MIAPGAGSGVTLTSLIHEKWRYDLGDGAWLIYEKSWLDPAAFKTLRECLAWKQESVRMMGREIPMPRLTAWYGDPGAVYTYAGRTFEPLPWTPELRAIQSRLAHEEGIETNSCLCNLYRNGRDSIGLHADDERELGPLPQIASVSLGSTRRFVLRQKGCKVEVTLGAGDLLIMGGTTQQNWKHEIPKTAAQVGERVNLTFRLIRHHPRLVRP